VQGSGNTKFQTHVKDEKMVPDIWGDRLPARSISSFLRAEIQPLKVAEEHKENTHFLALQRLILFAIRYIEQALLSRQHPLCTP
jgi:hypothetical protein